MHKDRRKSRSKGKETRQQRPTPAIIEPHSENEMALVDAVCQGRIHNVHSLIAAGTDVNTHYHGESLLCFAVHYDQRKIVEILRAAGAKLNFREAAMLGDTHRIQELLDQGANVEGNSGDSFSSSALVLAAGQGRTRVVELLLAHGANVDAANIHGETALIEAAEKGFIKTVRALLQGKADVNLIPFNGEAALLHASNAKVARLLLDYGAEVDEGGSDYNRYFRYNWTPLFDATIRKDRKRMRLLLERGADTNRREQEGRTCLMLAANIGYREGVKLLLQFGADVRCQDAEDRSALAWAKMAKKCRAQRVVIKLLKRAAVA